MLSVDDVVRWRWQRIFQISFKAESARLIVCKRTLKMIWYSGKFYLALGCMSGPSGKAVEVIWGKGRKVHEFHGWLIGDHALLSDKNLPLLPPPIRTVKLNPRVDATMLVFSNGPKNLSPAPCNNVEKYGSTAYFSNLFFYSKNMGQLLIFQIYFFIRKNVSKLKVSLL